MAKITHNVKVDDFDYKKLHDLTRKWSIKGERTLSLGDVIHSLIAFEEQHSKQAKKK